MNNMVTTLVMDALSDVVRLISRSGKIDWPIRKREMRAVLAALTDAPNVDQIFDKIYPQLESAVEQQTDTIDLSTIIDWSINPNVDTWTVVFMNSVLHSILEGAPIKVIKVPTKVDTVILSVFTKCVEGANKIRNEKPEEIRILPSSSRKEVKE